MDLKSFVEKAAQKAQEVATVASEQARLAAPAPPAQSGDEASAGALAPVEAPAASATTANAGATAAAALAALKDVGASKVQELMCSFQQALPAIKTAGYELTEFEIELGVTPKLIPHFRHAAKSAEDIERAREAVRDNKLGALILNGLLKAGDVHRQINVAGYCFSHVEIELGLIPSVRLQYKNEAAPR